MFGKRSFASSKDRSGKIQKQPKRSFRDASDLKQKQKKMVEKLDARKDSPMMEQSVSPSLTSAIVTVVVGPDQRLFAAHEDVLSHAPFFAHALHGQFFESANRRIDLPTEEPEVFSCILEYLYKGDYYPRLVHDRRRQTWMLEGATTSPDPNKTGDRAAAVEPTFFTPVWVTLSSVTQPCTALLIAMASKSSRSSPCASRACRAGSRSERSCVVHDMPTRTHRTMTRGCALITSL